MNNRPPGDQLPPSSSEAPAAFPDVAPPLWDQVPQDLAHRQQWLLWKFERKPGQAKPAKMPYYVTGGRRTGDQGSDKDRHRLATLAVARKAFERGGYHGVGFAFLPDDGLIGIDIDGAIDADTGEVSARCQAIVQACNSFTEYSPSGRGVHIIVQGTTTTNKCNDIGLEMFCGRQYFTFTARRWPDAPPDVRPIDDGVLRRLHATIDEAKEAHRAAGRSGSASPGPTPAAQPDSSGGDDFHRVNEAAMASLPAWVPALLPKARAHGQGYRVTSKDLGRDLQEDLSIRPDGIVDWGVGDMGDARQGRRTPIDLVIEWLPAPKPVDALEWLAQRVGVEIARKGKRKKLPRAKVPATAGSGSSDAAGGGGGDAGDHDGGGGDDWEDPRGFRLLRNGSGKPHDCRENVLYCLRHDELLKGLVAHNQFTELQDKLRSPPWGGDPGEWTEEDDLMLGEYIAQAHKVLIKGSSTLRAGVQMAARENKYHPVMDALRSVKWDGVNRLDMWMIDCLGVEDRPYARLVSRFFILGMVARLLRPGCKFDYMLILQGEQGLGKSSAFRALADPWFMDTPFRIGDKDAYLSLQGVWLVEFSELEAMSKSESTAIKAFVTSMEDRFRPPYGSRMVKMPRRAVLAGTTNSDQFLKDATGERRFWPVHVTEVEVDTLASMRAQLFAEAIYVLETLKGTEQARYFPTRAEEQELFHPEQDKWRMVDVWTDILSDYVNRDKPAKDDDPDVTVPAKRGFFSSQELFDRALAIKAERMDNGKLMQARVANAMRELGFASVREPTGARKRGYLRQGWEFSDGGTVKRRMPVVAPQAPSTGNDDAAEGGDDDLPL